MKSLLNLSLIVLSLFLPVTASAQLLDPTAGGMEEKAPDPDLPVKAIEINTDVSSLVVGLFGGWNGPLAHFGLQVKRFNGLRAMRFTGEFYPQTEASMFVSNRRIIGVDDDMVQYLRINYFGQRLRLGLGGELGKAQRWGRIYVATDLMVDAASRNVSASTFWEDPLADPIDNLGNEFENVNSARFESFAIGLIPAGGYDFSAWKRFGFNLEFRMDMSVETGESHWIEDDATIIRGGNYFGFNFNPLLNARFYFRI